MLAFQFPYLLHLSFHPHHSRHSLAFLASPTLVYLHDMPSTLSSFFLSVPYSHPLIKRHSLALHSLTFCSLLTTPGTCSLGRACNTNTSPSHHHPHFGILSTHTIGAQTPHLLIPLPSTHRYRDYTNHSLTRNIYSALPFPNRFRLVVF